MEKFNYTLLAGLKTSKETEAVPESDAVLKTLTWSRASTSLTTHRIFNLEVLCRYSHFGPCTTRAVHKAMNYKVASLHRRQQN